MREQLWPSREESAAMNLRRAISETRGDFVVEWIERGTEGYFVLFRRGNVVHREPGIGLAVLARRRSGLAVEGALPLFPLPLDATLLLPLRDGVDDPQKDAEHHRRRDPEDSERHGQHRRATELMIRSYRSG
jgi:hypothetical protein